MSSIAEPLESPFDALLENLDLESLDADLFLGDPGRGQGRLSAGFAIPEEGIAHQDPMPEAPGPEGLAARALHFGAVYRPDGQRVASVAQDGLIRRRSQR